MKHTHWVSRSPASGRIASLALLACAALALVACSPVKVIATTNIPTPLVAKVPVTVALHVPKEFSEYVHKEERWSQDWNIELGKAQTDGIKRLLNAMFERVVVVDSVNAGAELGDVQAILEPSVEEYAFVTPRDAGSPFFAVSIKYRVNVYSPDGRIADSWGFTGYGTSPTQGLTNSPPLARATALALRDAGAKLAVEFREQAIVRGLMPAAPASEPESEPPVEEPAPAEAPPAETPPVEAPPVEAPPAAPPAEASPSEAPPVGAPTDEKSEPEPESKPVTSRSTRSLATS